MQYGVNPELSTFTHQGRLLEHLHLLFPGKIHINARKEGSLRYPATGALFEVDAFVPELNIGFEFQDSYHYVTTWYQQRTLEGIEQKDNLKVAMLHQKGMDLLAIPCWWDGKLESLVATIYFHRPDIFPELKSITSDEISLSPPFGYFQVTEIPNVGELMLASFPLDSKFGESLQINSWWMGEKHDGIRCCWNPKAKKLYSRRGKPISVLAPFLKLFPTIFVDGELCFGRGQFSYIYKLLKDPYDFTNWDQLRVIAFDVPSSELTSLLYEQRFALLISYISQGHPFTIVVPRVLCESHKHMESFVQEIIDKGGEGVILQKVDSPYQHGRSKLLMKLKTSLGDQEAVVIGKTDDGSVRLKLPSGKTFTVPPTDIHITSPSPSSSPSSSSSSSPSRSPSSSSSSYSPSLSLLPTPLKIGEIVSFSYEIHARRDKPSHPKIYRIRNDLSWNDVLQTYYKDRKYLGDTSRVEGFTAQPLRYWTLKNMRLFLENFAKKKNLDPLLPSTWYTISYDAIRQMKGGSAILGKFKGGYFNTLEAVFPEIGLDASTFRRYSWQDIRNRRRFFELYAKRNGFDPLVAENWYTQSREKILAVKGADRAIGYHNDSVSQALVDLFPNIGLEKHKFRGKGLWRDAGNRRKFFEIFARDHGFDPLIPGNWYSQSKEAILSAKGAHHVLRMHSGRISQALFDLFPEIGLVKSKFYLQPIFKSRNNRRKFFEKYARVKGFDPLVPENWYSQSKESILETPVASKVIYYHRNSVIHALLDLFPDIGLEESKFEWNDIENPIKIFFETYAQKNDFDPLLPKNWYAQQFSKILSSKGSSGVKVKYFGRVSNALMDAFPNIGLEKAKLAHKSLEA